MATATQLLSAEQFRNLPDAGHPLELERGVVVDMNQPGSRHGEVCGNICYELRTFAKKNRCGRVLSNDSGVVTEHEPDTVRGPDVSFYSEAKVPPGPMPVGYIDVMPEAVFEVLSPTDRLANVLRKVSEYLAAGIDAVYVADFERRTVQCYLADQTMHVLTEQDDFVGRGVLSDFRVPVARFFE